jgi:hypothetical protein
MKSVQELEVEVQQLKDGDPQAVIAALRDEIESLRRVNREITDALNSRED